jgi:hypothetical protein
MALIVWVNTGTIGGRDLRLSYMIDAVNFPSIFTETLVRVRLTGDPETRIRFVAWLTRSTPCHVFACASQPYSAAAVATYLVNASGHRRPCESRRTGAGH